MPTLKPVALVVGGLSLLAVFMVVLALYVREDTTAKQCKAIENLRDAVHAVVVLAPGAVVPTSPAQARAAHEFQNAIEQQLDRVEC